VEIPGSEPHRALFAESPSRAVVSCEPKSVEALLRLADDCGVTAAEVGTVASDVFDLGTFSVSADVVNEVFENAFEAALTTRVG
jgi:hypothetical protein